MKKIRLCDDPKNFEHEVFRGEDRGREEISRSYLYYSVKMIRAIKNYAMTRFTKRTANPAAMTIRSCIHSELT